jgi:hypothetical protein
MTLTEYRAWYQQHYGVSPTMQCVESFKALHPQSEIEKLKALIEEVACLENDGLNKDLERQLLELERSLYV